jgi:hypothetical protein
MELFDQITDREKRFIKFITGRSSVRVLRDAPLLFGEITLEKPKNLMNRCPLGFWQNAGRCTKRHENVLRIGTFWHQIGGRSLRFRLADNFISIRSEETTQFRVATPSRRTPRRRMLSSPSRQLSAETELRIYPRRQKMPQVAYK